MALAALSLAAASVPLGTAWFLPWRLAAGVAGGVLMILAGPAVQAAVSPSVRGVAAGMMFTGVGGGILAGALIVPALLPLGVAAVWLALAATAVGLTALSWPLWPDVAAPRRGRSRRLPRAAWGLVAAYAASAVAATPHIVWWPDFVARGLGLGTGAGAAAWVGYGIGAMAGPAVLGRLADRAGTGAAYRVALIGQIAADALPLLSGSAVALAASTLLAAATMVGLTALTLSRARARCPREAPAIWRAGTCLGGGADGDRARARLAVCRHRVAFAAVRARRGRRGDCPAVRPPVMGTGHAANRRPIAATAASMRLRCDASTKSNRRCNLPSVRPTTWTGTAGNPSTASTAASPSVSARPAVVRVAFSSRAPLVEMSRTVPSNPSWGESSRARSRTVKRASSRRSSSWTRVRRTRTSVVFMSATLIATSRAMPVTSSHAAAEREEPSATSAIRPAARRAAALD